MWRRARVRELAAVRLALADRLRDLGVVVARTRRGAGTPRARPGRAARAARGRPATASRPARRASAGSAPSLVGQDRLRQPLADVHLAPGPRGAQLVDREPGHDGREVRLRRLDLDAVGERPLLPQERLLHDVLRLADAAEHAVGDREQQRAQPGEVRVVRQRGRLRSAPADGPGAVRPSRKPVPPARPRAAASRARAWPCAFDEPRTSVIIDTPTSPATIRPIQRGTCRGGRRTDGLGQVGQPLGHAARGRRRRCCRRRARRARSPRPWRAAASSTWIHDQTPAPAPTIGNLRPRTSSTSARTRPGRRGCRSAARCPSSGASVRPARGTGSPPASRACSAGGSGSSGSSSVLMGRPADVRPAGVALGHEPPDAGGLAAASRCSVPAVRSSFVRANPRSKCRSSVCPPGPSSGGRSPPARRAPRPRRPPRRRARP